MAIITTTTTTNTNATVYGLTVQTVSVYREAVAMGYNWSTAMSKMKALYEHNKAFAEGLEQ